MKKPSAKNLILLTTSRHGGKYLAQEAGDIFIEPQISNSEIEGVVEWEKFIEVLPFLRTANGIYLKLGSFSWKEPQEITNYAKNFDWTQVLESGLSYKIHTVKTQKLRDHFSSLKNLNFASMLFKDGINDFYEDQKLSPPNVDLEKPGITIHVRIREVEGGREECHLYLPLNHKNLSHRGYREKAYKAPLRENLAQMLVMASEPGTEKTFVDPMCGTGTLVLEYLYNKLNLPFFQLWSDEEVAKNFFLYSSPRLKDYFSQDLHEKWKSLRKEKQQKLEDCNLSLLANDLDAKSLDYLKSSLEALGAQGVALITRGDFRSIDLPKHPILMLTNPPYGKRVETKDLDELYYQLGEWIKHFPNGSRGHIFSCELSQRKNIHLQTSKRLEFFNGPLEARLWEYQTR